MDSYLIVILFVIIFVLFMCLFVLEYIINVDNLELYYDLSNDNMRDSVIVELDKNLDETLTYYSIQHAFMTNSKFIKNKDLISFIGIRTTDNVNYNIPKLYKEEVSIKMENGDYVVGSSIYTDTGLQFKTIGIPYVEYVISLGTCIFERYSKIRIYLDNSNNTRKVVFI